MDKRILIRLLFLFFIMGNISCSRLSLLPFSENTTETAPKDESRVVEQQPSAELKVAEGPEVVIEKVLTPYFDKSLMATSHTQRVMDFCNKIDQKFLHWGWGLSACRDYGWNHVRDSVSGDPLMWTVFGDENIHRSIHQNMTLIMCGVHGDEITPIKFCFDIIKYLNENFFHSDFKDSLVVVFPIANPDSFFKDRPTRTNANGVDINRNLPTKDWDRDAMKIWRSRYRSDPRRNPGPSAMSEPETLTQVNMIKRYRPDKIVSVHAPLTILDYDGPVELHAIHGDVGASASELLVQMSQKAAGYEIRNYPFFPGSLGNYAGNERGIPTYTLELPSSDNRKHREYWDQFRKAIRLAVIHSLGQRSDKLDPVQVEASSH